MSTQTTYDHDANSSDLLLICTRHGQQEVRRQGINDITQPARYISLILGCGCEFQLERCKAEYLCNVIEDDVEYSIAED